MYPLFSSASADAVRASQILAVSASIEPLLEGCSYIGFIIQLESPRVLRRLHCLREWSHEETTQVFP